MRGPLQDSPDPSAAADSCESDILDLCKSLGDNHVHDYQLYFEACSKRFKWLLHSFSCKPVLNAALVEFGLNLLKPSTQSDIDVSALPREIKSAIFDDQDDPVPEETHSSRTPGYGGAGRQKRVSGGACSKSAGQGFSTRRPQGKKGSRLPRIPPNGDGDVPGGPPRAPGIAEEPPTSQPKLPFACPYQKKGECDWYRPLNRIPDVRLHIYRKHQQPIHCRVCGFVFPSSDIANSLRDEHELQSACEPRQFHYPGATPDQIRGIASSARNRRDNLNILERERWYVIWRHLFPLDTPPSSPYLDGDVSSTPEDRRLRDIQSGFQDNEEAQVRDQARHLLHNILAQVAPAQIDNDCSDLEEIVVDAFRQYLSGYLDYVRFRSTADPRQICSHRQPQMNGSRECLTSQSSQPEAQMVGGDTINKLQWHAKSQILQAPGQSANSRYSVTGNNSWAPPGEEAASNSTPLSNNAANSTSSEHFQQATGSNEDAKTHVDSDISQIQEEDYFFDWPRYENHPGGHSGK